MSSKTLIELSCAVTAFDMKVGVDTDGRERGLWIRLDDKSEQRGASDKAFHEAPHNRASDGSHRYEGCHEMALLEWDEVEQLHAVLDRALKARKGRNGTRDAVKIIEFRGHSDDTFGFDVLDTAGKVLDRDDHDDCANGKVRAYRVESLVTGTAVIVIGVYSKCPGATWAIGLSPDDEDIAIPDWAASPTFKTDGYTPVLSLKAPDDATVQLVCVDGRKVGKEPVEA